MSKNIKNMINEWLNSIIKLAFSILLIIGAIWGFKGFILQEVNNITNNDAFLDDLASKINPYLIFDSNESYLYDGGALKYIDNIEVIQGIHPRLDDSTISPVKIIVTANRVFPFEPQLSYLNGDGVIKKGKRGKQMIWIYNIDWASVGIDTFRIDLIP